jgi:hypothetical protein
MEAGTASRESGTAGIGAIVLIEFKTGLRSKSSFAAALGVLIRGWYSASIRVTGGKLQSQPSGTQPHREPIRTLETTELASGIDEETAADSGSVSLTSSLTAATSAKGASRVSPSPIYVISLHFFLRKFGRWSWLSGPPFYLFKSLSLRVFTGDWTLPHHHHSLSHQPT